MAEVAFFYALGSPYAYLAALRIDDLFPDPDAIEWLPVMLSPILAATGRSNWGEGPERAAHQQLIDERAIGRGLPALNYPDPWPNNPMLASCVAIWAASQGARQRFTREAYKVQFVDGMPLAEQSSVDLAVERAGLDLGQARAAAEDPTTRAQVEANVSRAIAAGVFGAPTVTVDGAVFWGDDRLEEAAAAAKV